MLKHDDKLSLPPVRCPASEEVQRGGGQQTMEG